MDLVARFRTDTGYNITEFTLDRAAYTALGHELGARARYEYNLMYGGGTITLFSPWGTVRVGTERR